MENFLDKNNIKSKTQLKKIFFDTIETQRIGTIENTGLKLSNIDEKICYFITGINFIYRLRWILLKEIDELIDKPSIENIVDIINSKIGLETDSQCLSEIDAKNFNKYLVLQTMIEAGTLTDKKKCVNFIIKRLLNLQSYDDVIHRLIEYNQHFYDIINVINEKTKELDIYKLKNKINDLIVKNNISDINEIKNIYETQFNILYTLIDQNKDKLTTNYFNQLLPTECKIKRNNDALNRTFKDFGIYSGNSGWETENTFYRIIKILNTNKIDLYSFRYDNDNGIDLTSLLTTSIKPYIYINSPFESKLQKIQVPQIGNYKIATIEILTGRHVLLLVSYNNKFVVINDGDIIEIDNYQKLINGVKDINSVNNEDRYNLGPNIGKDEYIFGAILFEHINCEQNINELFEQYKKELTSSNLITAKSSGIEVNQQNHEQINFYNKYIKYKNKYLQLKNLK